MGRALLAQGRGREARQLLDSALHMAQRTLPPAHPRFGECIPPSALRRWRRARRPWRRAPCSRRSIITWRAVAPRRSRQWSRSSSSRACARRKAIVRSPSHSTCGRWRRSRGMAGWRGAASRRAPSTSSGACVGGRRRAGPAARGDPRAHRRIRPSGAPGASRRVPPPASRAP
ncbi:MAG: hypothetical protein IPK33_04760 [Gemmatimonadetes bacterium]|nr:hypothetical protein [Gemmatimonadota bacterium]